MVQVRKVLTCLLVLFSVLAPARAESQRVRSLKILVDLQKDGTAQVYEQWDVATGDRITEWYLVRENLGDITIDSLEVCVDEVPLHYQGEWDVNRTLEQKAGQCGIVHKYNGVELCWGIGSHGDHLFEALYPMHGAVKSARDYDYLHLQLVSPGLSSPPEKVRVFIQSHQVQLDTTVARVWGFGYEGICIFEHGRVVMEGDGAFDSEDSVIVLLRLDKGILEPTSVRDWEFQQVLDRAMEGADFGTDEEEEDNTLTGFLGLLGIFGGWLAYRANKKRKQSPDYLIKKLLGVKLKDITWYRDIPFKGNLPATRHTLVMLGEDTNGTGNLTSALILRMIYNGYLKVNRLAQSQQTEIRFTDKDTSDLDALSLGLYKMMKQAAGENQILEKKEFTTWSKAHSEQSYEWTSQATSSGKKAMEENGWLGKSADVLSASGKQEGIHLLGMRKFLTEFTFTAQREAFEANLWKEYLVFGAILGIAKVVAQQLKEIAPEAQVYLTTSEDFSYVVRSASALYLRTRYNNDDSSSSSGRSSRSYSSNSSSHGYGGRSSHSGGHGYSGGGRGGGGR